MEQQTFTLWFLRETSRIDNKKEFKKIRSFYQQTMEFKDIYFWLEMQYKKEEEKKTIL